MDSNKNDDEIVYLITIKEKSSRVEIPPTWQYAIGNVIEKDPILNRDAKTIKTKFNVPDVGQISVYMTDFAPTRNEHQTQTQLKTLGTQLQYLITQFYPHTEGKLITYHDFVRMYQEKEQQKKQIDQKKKKVSINNKPLVQIIDARPKPQPPVAAKDFPFQKKKGLDGSYWISTQKSNEAFYWKRMVKR